MIGTWQIGNLTYEFQQRDTLEQIIKHLHKLRSGAAAQICLSLQCTRFDAPGAFRDVTI